MPRDRRRTRPPRRSAHWPHVRRLRIAAACALLAALALLPWARGLARAGWDHARTAVEAARAAEAQERELRRYARQYGISTDLAAAVLGAALAEGVPPELAFRLVRVESAFREQAVSPVGALGLTQLMPATAEELQPGISREEILRRETNLRLGLRYFRRLLRYYHGDVDEALHAYNRGMGTVERIRARGGDPANGYASKVLGSAGASPVRPTGAPPPADRVPVHEMAPARLKE